MLELLYYFSRCWPLFWHCKKEKTRKREGERESRNGCAILLCRAVPFVGGSHTFTNYCPDWHSQTQTETNRDKQTQAHLLCRYSSVFSLSLSLSVYSHLPSVADILCLLLSLSLSLLSFPAFQCWHIRLALISRVLAFFKVWNSLDISAFAASSKASKPPAISLLKRAPVNRWVHVLPK